MISVQLLTRGYSRHDLDQKRIIGWNSKEFEIVAFTHYDGLEEPTGPRGEYTDPDLDKRIPHDSNVSLTIAIIDAPMSGNFYSRRLNDNRIVLSLFHIGDILASRNITIENCNHSTDLSICMRI